MEELLIAAAVLAAVRYFGSSSTPSVLTSTPAPSPPSSTPIDQLLAQGYWFDANGTLRKPSSGAGLSLSGGYQLTPASTQLAVPSYTATAISQPTFVAPPPVPQAAPYVSGGIAGTAFSGGNPYGSALRPGVSAGTGTTVIPTFIRPVAL